MIFETFYKQELDKKYMTILRKALKREYEQYECFPKAENIFRAWKATPFETTRAVIVGQDPYPSPGVATGLAFGVPADAPLPPSLRNIFAEVGGDTGRVPIDQTLEPWTKQGVLLLNSVLTVRARQPGSHRFLDWERFTDRYIELLNGKDEPVVFILWGNFAKNKAKLITNPKHLILEAPHPSPLSAYNGFFGCKHFTKANAFLKCFENGEIDWCSGGSP